MAEERKKWEPSRNNTPTNLAAISDALAEGVALPAMEAAEVEALRRRGTLTKALPPIANVGSDPLVGYSTKARDAAQLAYETGLSYADTKLNIAKMKALSDAESEQQEKFFRDKNRGFKKRLGSLSRFHTGAKNSYIKRFAGEMLGVGPDLYKVLR